jgi:hypothetical protein
MAKGPFTLLRKQKISLSEESKVSKPSLREMLDRQLPDQPVVEAHSRDRKIGQNGVNIDDRNSRFQQEFAPLGTVDASDDSVDLLENAAGRNCRLSAHKQDPPIGMIVDAPGDAPKDAPVKRVHRVNGQCYDPRRPHLHSWQKIALDLQLSA